MAATTSGSFAIPGISDTAGLTWNVRDSGITGGSPSHQWKVWYAVANTPLSSDVITISLSQSDKLKIIGFGISGANINSPFDSNSAVPSVATGSGTSASTTISTSNSYTMIIGMVAEQPTETPTLSGSGYTSIGTTLSGSPALALEYKIVSSSQNGLAVDYSFGTSIGWAIFADAIVASSQSTPVNSPIREVVFQSARIPLITMNNRVSLLTREILKAMLQDGQIGSIYSIEILESTLLMIGGFLTAIWVKYRRTR